MMLSLLLYLLLTAPDRPEGLGQLGLSVVKRYPDSMMVREEHGRGGSLSEDGALYFAGYGSKQPVYDMAAGEYWYDEWIVVRKSKSRGWQFGTQSQWGHISVEDSTGFVHTPVLIAPSKSLWVSIGGSDAQTFVVSFILPETRGEAPNVNASVPRLHAGQPGFRRRALWSDGSQGNYYYGRLTKEGSQYLVRAYQIVPVDRTAKLLARPVCSGPVLPKIKGEEIRPTSYDPHSQRLLYGGMTVRGDDPAKNFSVGPREWDAKAKVWRDLSFARKSVAVYWRGKMLAEDKDTDELFLVSDDRKSLKLIGKYKWLATSASGEFCFVREMDTGDYLLLKTSD